MPAFNCILERGVSRGGGGGGGGSHQDSRVDCFVNQDLQKINFHKNNPSGPSCNTFIFVLLTVPKLVVLLKTSPS